VAIDTTNGIRATWNNNGANGAANGFSSGRFYHVWAEQQATASSWITDTLHAHYFVSDTTWLADSPHSLGNNPTDPVRLRVVPLRLEFDANLSTLRLTEHPEAARLSDPFLPDANDRTNGGIITVIVDTRPATGGTCNGGGTILGTAAANAANLQVEYNGLMQPFSAVGTLLAQNYAGRNLLIEAKQRTDCTTSNALAKALLYQNSTTTTAISTTTNATTNTAEVKKQVESLLKMVQERLKSASYQNYNASLVRIVVQ
jgi:hypothetical protein